MWSYCDQTNCNVKKVFSTKLKAAGLSGGCSFGELYCGVSPYNPTSFSPYISFLTHDYFNIILSVVSSSSVIKCDRKESTFYNTYFNKVWLYCDQVWSGVIGLATQRLSAVAPLGEALQKEGQKECFLKF